MRADAAERGAAGARVIAGSAFAAATVLLAAASAWPVYRTGWLAVTAGGAVAAAVIVAAVTARLKWGGWATAAALLVVFAVLGVPLAVPSQATDPAGFARGLLDLGAGLVTGGKDLLTVDLPVGTYRNLLVPAFAVFLVGTCALLRLAWRPGRLAYAAVAVSIAMVAFGLLFGSREVSDPLVAAGVALPAPRETAIGAGTLVAGLLWLSWRSHDERMRALARAVEAGGLRTSRRSSGADRRRTALGAGIVVAALVVAVAVVPFAARGTEREVLRAATGPEVALARAISPLVEYRSLFADDRADDVLFTVEAADGVLPQRVRLATLDDYDGTVFRAGGAAAAQDARYERVPARLDAGPGDPVEMTVTMNDSLGIWMPTAGRLGSVRFEGPRAAELADGFYYNPAAAAGVQTAGGGLAAGDVVHVEAVEPAVPDLAASAAPGVAAGDKTPDALRTWLERREADESGAALAGAVALLRDRGYLSHALSVGEEPAVWMTALEDYAFQPSAAGHSLARIEAMFTRLLEREADPRAAASGSYVAAVGDDEQFAVATALLARELGFPSRVVVGARLWTDDPGLAVCEQGVCRAQDITAWTEVQDVDGTWVPVDVTPQHAQSPALEVTEQRDPENVTEVRPDAVEEVVPPDSLQEDSGARGDDVADDGADLTALWAAVRAAAIGVLILLLVAGPFAVVLLAKAVRRRARRRAAGPVARVAGGWDEYVDAAVDAGRQAPARATRTELATAFATPAGTRLATAADRAVFSDVPLGDEDAAAFWRIVDDERRTLARAQGFWRRLAMTVSLRSFVRPAAPAGAAKRLAERGKRAARVRPEP
ncbi:transglutaminase-like domain-containing protein [Microbacterium aureliae]